MTKFRLGYISLAVLLAFVALVRVLSNYPHTAQAFDEPIHVAAGIELLDRGTYTSDPVHPPLARLAIGLPLYIAGERYPKAPLADLNAVGNAILNDSGRYIRNRPTSSSPNGSASSSRPSLRRRIFGPTETVDHVRRTAYGTRSLAKQVLSGKNRQVIKTIERNVELI